MMKTVIGQLLLIGLLVVAGVVLWIVGGAEQRVAAAERTLATLRYDRAVEELDTAAATNAVERIIGDVTGTAGAATESQRKASYWLGDYEAFLNTDDADLKMLAADASFRVMREQGGTWQSVATRLDAIAKRYADVLRDHPENEDAAYNYEFVVRLRAAVTAARQPIRPFDLATTGISVHGHAGGPPEGSDMKKFKMIVPMRPDERMEAEEAGRGAQKIRKG
jgi:hypothetical protein